MALHLSEYRVFEIVDVPPALAGHASGIGTAELVTDDVEEEEEEEEEVVVVVEEEEADPEFSRVFTTLLTLPSPPSPPTAALEELYEALEEILDALATTAVDAGLDGELAPLETRPPTTTPTTLLSELDTAGTVIDNEEGEPALETLPRRLEVDVEGVPAPTSPPSRPDEDKEAEVPPSRPLRRLVAGFEARLPPVPLTRVPTTLDVLALTKVEAPGKLLITLATVPVGALVLVEAPPIRLERLLAMSDKMLLALLALPLFDAQAGFS